MKKIILFTAIVFTVFQCFSQKEFATKGGGSSGGANNNFDIYLRTIDINQKALTFGLTEAEFNVIKDKAYANSNFIEGNIYQDDKLLKSKIPMRYNAYADEIEIKNDVSDENYGALMKDPSIYAKIANDIYVFIPFDGSNEEGGYFNILSDGKKYDLYKKTKAVFKEPQKATTSYGNNTPPSFEKNMTYYLMQNGTLYELPTSKSKILKMMDSKRTKVKTYISDNNINVDNEKDLVKVVTYFDSLL